MLSRKHKPVLHPQRQRNTLADRSSLAGFGGKSWNSLRVRHLLARTLIAPEISPFFPLVTFYTWMRYLLCGYFPLWESGGVRRSLLTWSDYSTYDGQISKPGTVSCMASQGQWNEATRSPVAALGIGGEGENREGKGVGFGFRVCAGKAHWVLPLIVSAPCLSDLVCVALLGVSSPGFWFLIIQLCFCSQKLLNKLGS